MGDHSSLGFRVALPDDAEACVALRGVTRENAVSEDRLRSLGITAESWAEDIRVRSVSGYICEFDGDVVGYCFGSNSTGEVVVLAVRPDFEHRGVGRRLLSLVSDDLFALGHTRLFLGCSPDSRTRSYGFYRYLGWRSTGDFDAHGDEILEIQAAARG